MASDAEALACDECGLLWTPASKELFAQKQRKRLKAGKKALCRTCRPLATAEVKAATEAAELAAFNANASSGAMDGVARTVRGRKRKAQAPTQHMKDESVLLFAELQTTYSVDQFNYMAAAERQTGALQAALNCCDDRLSATGLRLSAALRELEGAKERLASLTWIDSQVDRAVPEAQECDFMSTLRAGGHGSRERVRSGPRTPTLAIPCPDHARNSHICRLRHGATRTRCTFGARVNAKLPPSQRRRGSCSCCASRIRCSFTAHCLTRACCAVTRTGLCCGVGGRPFASAYPMKPH